MLAAVRIKGIVNTPIKIRATLKMIRLDEPNYCSLVPNTPSYRGMLHKVKDFITFGEIDKETVIKMLKKRMRLKGGKRIEESMLKAETAFSSYEEIADAIMHGNAKMSGFKNIQPNFRLTPPSKGFNSTKVHYPKGDLGYRGAEIKELLERMI